MPTAPLEMVSSTSVIAFPALKKTRRYGAKVRTGCRTCKARRVKCDEGKPECARCASTGRKCDGYSQSASFSQALVASQSNSFQNVISTPSCLGDSVVYLEFYHHCAGPTLASNFDHEFWSRTVLQMAQSEQSIRHAAIALSYLVKSEQGSIKSAVCNTDTHRKTLLLHYNKAARCLIERMTDPLCPVEVGLVTCLLFICIEYLRGDWLGAFTHLYSGLKIISEWQQGGPKYLENVPREDKPPPFSRSISKRLVSPTMGASNLVPMFMRAMSTSIILGNPFEHLLEGFLWRPLIFQDRCFTSVLEAQSASHDLRNASLIMISRLTRTINALKSPAIEDLQERQHLLSCHESWLRALETLENEGHLSSEERIVASSLKVSYYCMYAGLAAAIGPHQLSFDEHIPCFQAMNHHATLVLESMDLSYTPRPVTPRAVTPGTTSSSPLSCGSEESISPPRIQEKAGAHFTFEMELILPLFYSAIRCRCPTTRRVSLSLLERNPPREGIWDAEQHAMVARRSIEIEESELDPDTGWPTQNARLVNSNIDGKMDQNGGFWVTFTSVGWVLDGSDPSKRRKGLGVPHLPTNEWNEWFVL